MMPRILLLLLVVFSTVASLKAQDPAPKAAASAGEAASFDEVYAQWKKVLGRLRELQSEYLKAPDSDKPLLEEEFNALMAEGRKMVPRLKSAAEKAFLAAPNKNKDITEFMLTAIQESIRTDDYEEAARIAKLLTDNNVESKNLPAMAGTAAMFVNDYESARRHLQAADKAGALDDNGKQMLADLDEQEQKWQVEKKIRDAEAKANDLPRVKLATSKGDIVIELFENEAPNSVASFISLVEKKFYDGLTFHRVLPNFMAQGGDPKGDGTGGPGYMIACECYRDDARKHFRGSLSMAHAGKDTGGSQFFLTFVPTSFLDGKHTVFGRVIEGFDVLSKLQRRDPDQTGQPKPDKIVKATVVRKRSHPYVPKKVK